MSGFNTGDTAYLIDGQEVEYVANSAGDHVVRAVFESDDDGLHYGKPFTTREVFAEAPTARYSARIAELKLEVEALKADAQALRKDREAFETEVARRAAVFKRHRALDRLEDFIEGRITHVVQQSYGFPAILTVGAAAFGEDEGRRADGMKLITLFGKTGGDLSWGVNRYYDGSGGNTTIHPARSMEEAREIQQSLIDAEMPRFRKIVGYMHGFNYWVEGAELSGAKLPTDLLVRWFQNSLESAVSAVDTQRDELTKREDAVRAAKAKVAALQSEPSA